MFFSFYHNEQAFIYTFLFWKAFVTVANITFNHHSFATREAHMLIYADDIYDQWINILEKHQASTTRGCQPSITTFRCLRGLEDDDVRLLQQELLKDKIFLVKQPHQEKDLPNILSCATNMKHTKVFVAEMLNMFKELNPIVDIPSWEKCHSH